MGKDVPALSHDLTGPQLGGTHRNDVAGNVGVHPRRAQFVVVVVVADVHLVLLLSSGLLLLLLLLLATVAEGDDAARAGHTGNGLGASHQPNWTPAWKKDPITVLLLQMRNAALTDTVKTRGLLSQQIFSSEIVFEMQQKMCHSSINRMKARE